MRQVEISRTLVFDAPARPARSSRRCSRDNIDLGRPENVELLFRRGQRLGGRSPAAGRRCSGPRSTAYSHRVTVNVFYKHSRVKQYLKDGRALRIETVVNSPG